MKIILEAVVFFYTLLVAHELSHLIAFKIQGIEINYIYIFPFVIKTNSTEINIRNGIKYLGIVVPKMEALSNMDLAKMQSKCANVMNSSTILHATLLLVFGAIYYYTDSMHALLAFVINFFMLCQGVVETPWAYGDIVAYEKIKKNQTEFFLYLAFVIIEDDEAENEDNNFLEKIFREKLEKTKSETRKIRITKVLQALQDKLIS